MDPDISGAPSGSALEQYLVAFSSKAINLTADDLAPQADIFIRQLGAAAVKKLRDEIRRLDAENVIVSTSIPTRNDGFPLSKPPVDGDHGVAAYFEWRGKSMCFACDRYWTVAGNLRGIALSIEALRTLERHGGTGMLEQAFTGFAALPSGGGLVSTDWRTVLGVGPGATIEEARSAWRSLLKEAHPDAGGSNEATIALNQAMEMAREELGG